MTARLQKQSRTKRIVGIVVGIVAALIVFAAAVGLVLSGGIDTLTRGFFEAGSSQYQKDVERVVAAQKTFTSDEVAQIGPYDVRILSVEDEYIQTLENDDVFYRKDVDEKFVRIELAVSYAQERAELYETIKTSGDDWIDALFSARLNDMAFAYGGKGYSELRDVAEMVRAGEPLELTRVYALPKGEAPEFLVMRTSIFAKVSFLVGTEGMPRESLEYKITIL